MPDGIDSGEILDQTGIKQAMKGNNLILIEWPERLEAVDFANADVFRLKIGIDGEKRDFRLTPAIISF